MNRKLRTMLVRAANRLAGICYPLYALIVIRPLWLARYSKERQLVRGSDPATVSDPSIIVFTVQRTASTFLRRFLDIIAGKKGLVRANMEPFYALRGIPAREKLQDPDVLRTVFHPTGYAYGPFRFPVSIPRVDEYRVVLLLRDPRDVLVSRYFSQAYSHPVLNRSTLQRRSRSRAQTIDEHVIEGAGNILARYEEYAECLFGLPNVLFWRFEDMLCEPREFVCAMNTFCNADLPESRLEQIIEAEFMSPEREDKYSHKRKAKSGDFREKLEPATIEHLNDKFDAVLMTFGFDH